MAVFNEEDTCSSWSVRSPGQLFEEESCSWSGEESWPSCDWSSPPNSPSSPNTIYQHNIFETPAKEQSSNKLWRSPRVPKARLKFDPSNIVKDDVGWQLSKVVELNGCLPHCAIKVHGLGEYDLLLAHSMFTSKGVNEQRTWLIEYFATHCPLKNGEKDYKNIQFMLCGKVVCQNLWQATLSISTSRFYDLRKDFLNDIPSRKAKKTKLLAPKSMKTLEWMRNYFNRVGDKRPDKDGIYLPTCLTERIIYNIMISEVPESSVVCFSQFNKLYRMNFANVSIPKVRM